MGTNEAGKKTGLMYSVKEENERVYGRIYDLSWKSLRECDPGLYNLILPLEQKRQEGDHSDSFFTCPAQALIT
jgi:hypothetical protein